jgi:hypothetical protein
VTPRPILPTRTPTPALEPTNTLRPRGQASETPTQPPPRSSPTEPAPVGPTPMPAPTDAG